MRNVRIYSEAYFEKRLMGKGINWSIFFTNKPKGLDSPAPLPLQELCTDRFCMSLCTTYVNFQT